MNNFAIEYDYDELVERRRSGERFHLIVTDSNNTSPVLGDRVFFQCHVPRKKGQIRSVVAHGEVTQDTTKGKRLRVRKNQFLVQVNYMPTSNKKFVKVAGGAANGDPVLKSSAFNSKEVPRQFRLKTTEAKRLLDLMQRTGKDWTYGESVAGLHAYFEAYKSGSSANKNNIYRRYALMTGRAVKAMDRKVMNFRAIDPVDPSEGYRNSGQIDFKVWNEFFDVKKETINLKELKSVYDQIWSRRADVASPLADRTEQDLQDDHEVVLKQSLSRQRKKQKAFRKGLLNLYGNKCAISKHGPPEALQAAHVMEHAGCGVNKYGNGLMLRADLHALFDKYLLRIHPETLQVQVANELLQTPYENFNGIKVHYCTDRQPKFKEYLAYKWQQAATKS